MKRLKCFEIGFFMLVSLVIASISFAGGVPQVWTEIDPAGVYPGFSYNGLTPACSACPTCTSDKFTFFVKGGTCNKLVVYFQGGGACWDSMNCLYYPTYNQQEFETIDMFANTEGMGIFDTDNPDNPFKDWNFVYIPYCTGDLFWGADDHSYPDYLGKIPGLDSWTIQHRGFVNFQVVLKWITDHYRWPRKIFVTGSSAGGYGAIIGFPYIKQAYPLSRVYVLGDAANGVTEEYFETVGINNWNVQLPTWIFPDGYSPDMTMADVYEDIAAHYPLSKLAQFTTAWDNNQTFFYNVMVHLWDPTQWNNIVPVWCDWHNQMLNLTHVTAAEARNYRYYIAAGQYHTIMMKPEFYTEDSAGTPFVDWVRAMVRNPFGMWGGPLQGKWKNLECEDCQDPVPCE